MRARVRLRRFLLALCYHLILGRCYLWLVRAWEWARTCLHAIFFSVFFSWGDSCVNSFGILCRWMTRSYELHWSVPVVKKLLLNSSSRGNCTIHHLYCKFYKDHLYYNIFAAFITSKSNLLHIYLEIILDTKYFSNFEHFMNSVHKSAARKMRDTIISFVVN
jgi:hypothetical protein